jgi:hypothetical protein
VVAVCGCGRGAASRAAAPAPYSPPEAAEPAPGPIDTAGLIPVRFARGTSSALVNDSLMGDLSRSYLLGALQGQVMLAHAITWPVREDSAPPARATVRVFSALDGRELTAPSGRGSLWSGRLPGTGDYVVRVSGSAPTAYTLAVQIPRSLHLRPGDPTAQIAGTAPSRAPVDYLVRGESGSRLAASLAEPGATLHVYGLEDGRQLAPLSERRREWAGTLPAAQDYIVSVVPAGEGAEYQLTVTLR